MATRTGTDVLFLNKM